MWLLNLRFHWFEQGSGYCGKCLRQSAVARQSVNHTPHLVLALVTCGVWAVFWVRDAKRTREWQCLECGATVYRLMSTRLENDKRRRWRIRWNAKKSRT